MADDPQPSGSSDLDLRFAHYRVLRRPDGATWELGRGAMGVTYKAYDEELRIDVALKVITPGQVDHPKAQALFLREARAAARVRHPNVASVVFLSTTAGNIFYAMEFIAGESLADWLRSRRALPPAMAIEFAIQIARGLEAIHVQHIVHRDLKPANLMILPSARTRPRESADANPEAWQIKIIDFGLARGFGGEGPGTELDAKTIGFRGTTLYASPEQCEEQRDLDGRSDQYSLGCILWEMLTGTPPFQGRTHRELLNQHVALPLPLQRLTHVPDGLQVGLARMLAKDPVNRFPDDDAVVEALERCRGNSASGDGSAVDVLATTRDAEPLAAARANQVRAGAATWSHSRTIGIALVAAALLIASVGWFFWPSQPTTPSPIAASATPPVAAVTLTAAPPAPSQAALSRKAVAVLPFENLSGRPEDAYLADGLQEEILNALARLRDLKVISRTSVMGYRGKDLNIREVGQRLGVGTIVEGSVRRDGNSLRLTIQVIDARDDSHLLATSYDREFNKVLDLQSAVARQVANALAATLTRQERGDFDRVATNNGDAYDRFLRATALFRQPVPGDEGGLIEPKRLLEEAVRLDPDYADAYAFLSQVNTWIYMAGNERAEDDAAAKRALESAFASDPKSPDAQLARGIYAQYVAKNRDQALADLGAVVKLRPNSAEAHRAYGFVLRRTGRMDEALEHLERAWDLDPLNKAYAGNPIFTLLGLRRYPEALQQTELYTARFPDEAENYFTRARLQARLGIGREPLHAAWRDHGNLLDPVARKWMEVEMAEADGRYGDAARLSTEVPAPAFPFYTACLYHAAGDSARADHSFRAAEAIYLERRQHQQNGELRVEDLNRLGIAQSMLGKHAEALATIELARARVPEVRDATNGPPVSFIRSFILVRAGRTEEGYAEVARLLRIPFGAPSNFIDGGNPIGLLTLGDPRFDELINHPPRL